MTQSRIYNCSFNGTIVAGAAPFSETWQIFERGVQMKLKSLRFDTKFKTNTSPPVVLPNLTQTSQEIDLLIYGVNQASISSYPFQNFLAAPLYNGNVFEFASQGQFFFSSAFFNETINFSYGGQNNDPLLTIAHLVYIIAEIDLL